MPRWIRLTMAIATIVVLACGAAGAHARTGAPAPPAVAAPCVAAPPFPAPPVRDVGSITALAADDIWVTGDALPGGPSIVRWDGRRWRPVPLGILGSGPLSPLIPGAGPPVIEASSATNVWALARSPRGTVAARWDGQRWRPTPLSLPVEDVRAGRYTLQAPTVLRTLAVLSPTDVWAVGSAGRGQFYAARWDGARWSQVIAPSIAVGPQINDITAIAPNDLWAVGSTNDGQPLALHWDGSQWAETILPTPYYPELESELFSISGTAPNDVWAVGYEDYTGAVDFIDQRPLIEHWDGTRWQRMEIPYTGQYAGLGTVLAVSPRDVWALGNSGAEGLIEHWDGARWRSLPQPLHGGIGAIAALSPDQILLGGAIQTSPGNTASTAPLIEQLGRTLCVASDPVVRTITLPVMPTAAALARRDHHLFALGSGAAMLDTASGQVLRTTPRSGTAVAATMDEATDHVFALANTCLYPASQGCPAAIDMLDAASGALLRVAALQGQAGALAASQQGGRAYALTAPDTTTPGTLSLIDSVTGTVILTRQVGLNPAAVAVDDTGRRVFVLNRGPGALVPETEGAYFAPQGAGSVMTLDAATGTLLRTDPVALDPGLAAMAFLDGRLYVQGGDKLTVLDAASGAIRSTATLTATTMEEIPPEAGALPPAAIATLYPTVALDPRDGRLIAAAQTHYDHYGQPNGGGVVAVADTRSDQLLSVTPIGYMPVATLLDPATGEAFVLTEGSMVGDELSAGGGPDGGYVPRGPGTVVLVDPRPARDQRVTTPSPAAPAPAAYGGARYFLQTRHNLGGPFLAYWLRHGGLATFGYPLSEPFLEDGHLAQFTERFLLELIDGQVRPAPLGQMLTAGRRVAPAPPSANSATHRYFPATGHTLSGRFLAYWQSHGGDAVLGPPISEPDYEQNGDGTGRVYLVQWCANARLEYHPELAGTPYAIELGRLGAQAERLRGWL